MIQRAKARHLRAKQFYRLITKSKLTEKQIRRAKEFLSQLRPRKQSVVDYYVEQGDSPAVAKMLVQNYEHLPVVHITKADYHVLLAILNGRAARHSTYIRKRFA